MNDTTGRQGMLVTVGVYGVLFVCGAVQGVIGSFQYSRTAGSVPLAAIGFCVVLLVTCVLAGWAMRSVSGAIIPAIGWIIASFVLSMPVSSGSVIIAASTPGEWYLYGGTISAVIAVIVSFTGMIRTADPARPRSLGQRSAGRRPQG